jgi:hypothetical protein
MGQVGRQTLCTPERIKAAGEMAEAGMFLYQIWDALDIGESTFWRWMKRGENGEEPYREFRAAIKKGEHLGLYNALKRVRAAENWQSDAWFLERRHGYRKDAPRDAAPADYDSGDPAGDAGAYLADVRLSVLVRALADNDEARRRVLAALQMVSAETQREE